MAISTERKSIVALFLVVVHHVQLYHVHIAGQITPGAELIASENKVWISENGSFAFRFTPFFNNKNQDDEKKLILGIWHATIPAYDRAILWSPNRNNPVGTSGILQFNCGNLLLFNNNNHSTPIWTTNLTSSTSTSSSCVLTETGNLILYDGDNKSTVLWQSFTHPTDTLLPTQLGRTVGERLGIIVRRFLERTAVRYIEQGLV